MGQVLHGCATTTHAVRTAIQRSKAPLKELAARYGLNHKTVAKWRKRAIVNDAPDEAENAALDGAVALRKKRSSSPSASIRCCRWTTAGRDGHDRCNRRRV